MKKVSEYKTSQGRKKPKIGLALGSGGARGLAHIGVLQVLEKHNVPIDYVAGSSMGSLVGALYAIKQTPDHMKQAVSLFSKRTWLDYTVPKMGFIAGEKIKELVRLLTKNKNIEQADIPLSVVATNIEKGERKVFTEGPMAEAIRASISIPGIFVPETIDGQMYVDGGVIDRVPVSVVKEMGADIVIAVDVSFYDSGHKINSIFDCISQSIDVMEREILKYRMIEADVVLRPKVGQYRTTMFEEVEQIVLEGERVALEMIPQVQEAIQNWKETNEHV